jgi:hypothetical protein
MERYTLVTGVVSLRPSSPRPQILHTGYFDLVPLGTPLRENATASAGCSLRVSSQTGQSGTHCQRQCLNSGQTGVKTRLQRVKEQSPDSVATLRTAAIRAAARVDPYSL